MSLSATQVYSLARQAGLSASAAVTATAVAMAESSLNPGATGDVGLENATWGPSVGLWQVRSLKAQTGTGGVRDASALSDPTFNARSMVSISNGGTNWRPWSTYTSGAYRQYLPAAQAAAAAVDGGAPVAPIGGLAAEPAGFTATPASLNLDPFDLFGIPGTLGSAAGSAAGDAVASAITGAVKATGPIILVGLLVAGGVALVVLGAMRAVEPAAKKAMNAVQQGAQQAAAVGAIA